MSFSIFSLTHSLSHLPIDLLSDLIPSILISDHILEPLHLDVTEALKMLRDDPQGLDYYRQPKSLGLSAAGKGGTEHAYVE
jgi:hypothetical protein